MSYTAYTFEDGKVLTAAQLNKMDSQIAANASAIENGTSEPAWDFTDDYQAELNNIVNALSPIQKNAKKWTTEFIIFSDLHKNTVAAHPEFYRMMDAINYLTYKLNIKFVAGLGDYIDTPVEGSNYGVYEELDAALKSLNAPFINIMGNHDWVAHIYKRNWATNIPNAIFDKVGAWFYFDDSQHDVRYIILDCQDRGNDANEWTTVTTKGSGVSDRTWQQLNWLANTALKTDKKVIFLGHQSLGVKQGNVLASTSNTDNYFIAKTICQAFEAGTAGEATYTKYYSAETTAQDKVTWDFTSQGAGTILFNVHGHTHGDIWTNENYTTASAVQSPFNELIIDDALYNTATYIGKANAKTLNTVNEIAFDVVSFDFLTNTITTYRFGTGQNRTCPLNGNITYWDYDTTDDDSTVETPDGDDLSSQFTWTAGGPVMFADGIAFDEEGYTSGTNTNLKYSNYVDISAYSKLYLSIPARTGSGSTGGYAFYTTNAISGFISDGASSRNGNNASAEGVTYHTATIPTGAKYIRTTYWSSNSSHSSTPFVCIGIE